MPTKVHKPCCTVQELDQSTLVTRLLELASLRAPNNKSAVWSESMSCLWIGPDDSRTLQLKSACTHSFNTQPYVAVSYCWEDTFGLQCNRVGKYRIVDTGRNYLRQSKVRDEVLARVIRYTKYVGVHRIWIDQECIAQDNSEEKQTAMDSMDLVYRYSDYPVGLLAVTLDTQDEVNSLQDLLMGCFTTQRNDDDYPRLVNHAIEPTSLAVYSMLERIHADRWWTRAWIFQEEYLSSTAMHILIRRRPGVAARRQFGFLHGEICINAAEFRKQATLFLLAFKRQARRELSKKCARMLKRFGKYNVQYHFQHDAKRKAMSPRIIADIQRRRLKQPFDRLPIVANSCDYGLRFVSAKMASHNHSVGLCLLTMYLLNGEILRDTQDIRKTPTEMDVCNYLQYISFNKFDPPVGEKHLSYLKGCRLPEVSLESKGLLTGGHLWTIEDVLPTDAWLHPPRKSAKRRDLGLDDFQRDHLFQLADRLPRHRSSLEPLQEDIYKYLEQDANCEKPSAAKIHMDLMAESVVKAIRAGQPLQIARAQKSAEVRGIFVGLKDRSLGVFTSWHAGVGMDDRSRETHVSLGVKVRRTKAEPLLRTVQWVNGLVFFRQRERTSVVFEWPRAWM